MGRVIKLLLYYLAYQMGFIGITMPYYFIKRGISDTTEILSDPLYFKLVILAQFLSSTAIILHLVGWKYTSLKPVYTNNFNWKRVLLYSIVLIVGMGLWTNYLNELADLPDNLKETFDMMMKNPVGIISIVIMAPLMEELLFRGAIQGHLLKKWKNPAGPILVSSLIFGVVHGNPAQIPFAFVLGIALGWVYYITGSLIPCILMHFINNGTAVLLFAISDNPNSTMISELGSSGAIAAALVGVVLTVISSLYIKKSVNEPIVWYQNNPKEIE